MKLVILDEADALTLDAQCALRQVIEKHTINTSFCLIVNQINKIIVALQSRCLCFHFQMLHVRAFACEYGKMTKRVNSRFWT